MTLVESSPFTRTDTTPRIREALAPTVLTLAQMEIDIAGRIPSIAQPYALTKFAGIDFQVKRYGDHDFQASLVERTAEGTILIFLAETPFSRDDFGIPTPFMLMTQTTKPTDAPVVKIYALNPEGQSAVTTRYGQDRSENNGRFSLIGRAPQQPTPSEMTPDDRVEASSALSKIIGVMDKVPPRSF